MKSPRPSISAKINSPEGQVGCLRQSAHGVAILLGLLQFLGSILWTQVGAGMYGSPLQGGGPWVTRVLLFLVTGPMSLLPASILATWRPRLGGLWLTVTAVVSAMAAVVVMAPLPENAHRIVAPLVSLGSVPVHQQLVFCDASYVFKWSLTLIIPFSLPMLIFGICLLVAEGDRGLIRRHWCSYEIRALLVLALSVSIFMVWFSVYVRRVQKQSERVAWAEVQRAATIASVYDRADLEDLKGLPNLRMLHLVGTSVTDDWLEPVKGMTALQELQLGKTQVTDTGLQYLKGLSQLQYLDLSVTKVTDAGLEHLEGLTHLHTLVLDGTKITDTGLRYIGELTLLQVLYLRGTEVTDTGLEHIKGLNRLRELRLWNTKITDEGLQQLKGLTQLQVLELNGTQVTDQGVTELKQALPNCSIRF